MLRIYQNRRARNNYAIKMCADPVAHAAQKQNKATKKRQSQSQKKRKARPFDDDMDIDYQPVSSPNQAKASDVAPCAPSIVSPNQAGPTKPAPGVDENGDDQRMIDRYGNLGVFISAARDGQVDEAIKTAREADQKFTRLEKNGMCFRATACPVCDCQMIGSGEVCKVTKSVLKSKENRIGVRSCEEFYGPLNEILKRQYTVEGYEGLLLSPRGKYDEDGAYVCRPCRDSLSRDHTVPPKFAIANGFFCGHLPEEIDGLRFEATEGDQWPRRGGVAEALTSDVLCAMLNPCRPYAFCITYFGGSHVFRDGHVPRWRRDRPSQ